MKNTAAFTALVEGAPAPITVTRNGYDAFIVMRSEEYEAMQLELARARLLSRVSQAEAEYAAGDYVDGKEFTDRMRREYGL
ncbi:MAG: type II toxin-antitoxin system Phd/YefM family antitoxin [Raoultibacter sp.]